MCHLVKLVFVLLAGNEFINLVLDFKNIFVFDTLEIAQTMNYRILCRQDLRISQCDQ